MTFEEGSRGLRVVEAFLFKQFGRDVRVGVDSLLVEEAEGRLERGVVVDDPAAMLSWTGRSTTGMEVGCRAEHLLGTEEGEPEEVVIRPLPGAGMSLHVDLAVEEVLLVEEGSPARVSRAVTRSGSTSRTSRGTGLT